MPPHSVRTGIHPIHAILLSFPIAFFTAALLFDITYLNSAEIQWSNFAQWAITGALVFGAPVVLWAIVNRIRIPGHDIRTAPSIYLLLVSVMWVLGLINALQHSKDAWSSVGTAGLLLSLLCAALALAAGWVAYGGAVPVTTNDHPISGEPA